MGARGRRGIAGCLLLVPLCLAGCADEPESSDVASDLPVATVEAAPGDDVSVGSEPHWVTEGGSWAELEVSPMPEHPTPTAALVPTPTPTFASPELDDTQLRADLAALSAADRSLVENYLSAPLGEGTWIVAAPLTVDEARLRLLGPEPKPARRRDFLSAESSAYAFLQVGDGVVAWEQSGFAAPSTRLLAALSRGGATSAVVTDNVEAMTRFGYARDGQVVFDAFEYAFVQSIDEIPVEVRDLVRLAWDDLQGRLVATADRSAVALAMAEKVTGVRGTPAVQNVEGKENWYAVPLPWGTADDS